jgi:hypothetical protein
MIFRFVFVVVAWKKAKKTRITSRSGCSHSGWYDPDFYGKALILISQMIYQKV